MKEAENLFAWLTTPPTGATMNSASTSRTNSHNATKEQKQTVGKTTPQKQFGKIVDVNDSTAVSTAVVFPYSIDDWELARKQHHPSHVPSPQTLHDYDNLGHAVTCAIGGALGGIQQSIQSLLEGNEHRTPSKSHVSSSQVEFPNRTNPSTVKSTMMMDAISPVKMGPNFWKYKAKKQLLGDACRKERERIQQALAYPRRHSPIVDMMLLARNVPVFDSSSSSSSLEDSSYTSTSETRDDALLETSNISHRNFNRSTSAPKDTAMCSGNKITSTITPLQRQWTTNFTENLHTSSHGRLSIRWLDSDVFPHPPEIWMQV